MADAAMGPKPAISHTSPGPTWARSSAGRSTRTMILALEPVLAAPAPATSSTRASAA